MTNYHDRIQHFDEPIVEMLISEAPHTSFGTVIPGLEFLKGGLVDLGFENIPDKALMKAIYLGFTQDGVAIPGTKYKMRAKFGMRANIEPIGKNDKILTLPENWQEYVHVIEPIEGKSIYVGSKLGAHQHADKM